jgi:hypothetical protein
MQITLATAQSIVKTLANNSNNINVNAIQQALSNIQSTTFATLTQASLVKTATLHKLQNIYKITVQNVTLCNSNANIYVNSVTKHVQATAQAQAFTAQQSNYTAINNSYSLCMLNSNNNKHYLRAIVNKCLQVVYYCANTNTLLSKVQVAKYLTASASLQLLSTSTSTSTTVQHANITHNTTVRNFSLQNIYSINVNKQTLLARAIS